MKLLFVADVTLGNVASGSERVLHHQAVGCVQEGAEVYAITRQSGPPILVVRNVAGVQEGSFGISSEEIPRAFLSLARYPPKLHSRFKKDSPFQAVIAHQPLNCFSLLIRRRLHNLPLLYVFHSPSHEEYLLSHNHERAFKRLFNMTLRLITERCCLKNAEKIMVLSRFMRRKVKEIHGIPEQRIVVNPGGVDLDRFTPIQDRRLLKAELGLPEGRIHLLTVRNLEPRMGLGNLIQCIHLLKEKGVGVHLILGGEGIEKNNLKNQIEKLGLKNDVTMTGFIELDLLPKYYGASDFFILPTKQLEGFGLVTPESMACGTPVLGTPVGGTKEILSGFDPEFLFMDTSPEAMAEGIEKAIGEYPVQSEKYEDLRDRCRRYVEENYSWKRHIEQLIQIIAQMV